jgi:predicted DNA-binding protein
LLLLTEEEARRLNDALTPYHISKSFIIQEAIQVGLQTLDLTNIPGRRSKILQIRLPAELRRRVRALAKERRISQQSLTRHFLFTYLSQLERKSTPPTKTRNHTSRGGSR